jgi:hypothetical protein
MATYNPTGYDNEDVYGVRKKKKKSPLRPEETVTTATQADVRAAQGQQADVAPRRSDTELNPRDIINYRRAGAALTDPNRTVEDVQRAVAERVRYGNAVRGASNYEQYRNADAYGNVAAAPPAVNQQNITAPPNLASPEDLNTARRQELIRGFSQRGIVDKIANSDVGQGIAGFAKNVGGFLKDAYQSNDPGYFTEPAYRSENVPGIVKAGVRAVDQFGRFITGVDTSPIRKGYDRVVNYGETGRFEDKNKPLDLSGGAAPSAALGDKLNPSLAGTEVPQSSNTLLGRTNAAATGNAPSAPAQEEQSYTYYKNSDGSFSDKPMDANSIAQTVQPRRQGVGGTQGGGALVYNNADPYNLQGQGGPGQLTGLRGRGANTPYARQNTGLQPTDNVANRYGAANLGALSGMNAGTYEGQVAAAQERNARSAARVRANRLAGASEGGDILRQINKLNDRAGRAYETALGRGMNSKAAARAAEAVQAQADNLVGAQSNLVRDRGNELGYRASMEGTEAYRERTAMDAQLGALGLNAAQAKIAAEAESLASERGYEMIKDIATVNGPDGPEVDYAGWALAIDMLGVDPRDRASITKNATALRGVIQARNEIATKLGYNPDGATMKKLFEEGAAASNLDWGDAFKEGDINLIDVLMSNIWKGPTAVRLGEDQAFKLDFRNLTEKQRNDLRLRDRDNPNNKNRR